jgi:hypothetical protein
VLTSTDTATDVYHRSLEKTLEEWGGDVRYYLEETVPKLPQYCVFVKKNPIFLERLIKHAGEVFIFAHLAVRSLKAPRHPNPEEQFKLLLSSDGVGLSPLDTLYLQILKSAFPPTDLDASPSLHAPLLSFLTIIALQQRPLTPAAMEYGLGLHKETIIWMTDLLRSALLIDKHGCVVSLHATFGEFLRHPNRCIQLYRVNPSKGHAQLASAYIAAFTFERVTGYLKADDDTAQRQWVHYAK